MKQHVKVPGTTVIKENGRGKTRESSTEIFNSHTTGLFNSKVFKVLKDNNF